MSLTDIVKRLRAFRPTYGWPKEQATFVQQTLAEEAAGHIETLEAKVEQWRCDFHELHRDYRRLRDALQIIRDNNTPRNRETIFRANGTHSKHDKCEHERFMYEDCDECTAAFARKALENAPA